MKYNLKGDIFYVGESDRRIANFENIFPLTNGVSYNSYIILGDKTILLDTVDSSVGSDFLLNIKATLGDRKLDYLIVNHMEPDHAANIERILDTYKEVTIIANAKTFPILRNYLSCDIKFNSLTVSEGQTLELGSHKMTFYMAPMVHWPEVMVTYDLNEKALFTADAFGTFGALNADVFCSNNPNEWLYEARRYYANIVGMYGPQVQALLKKAKTLDVELICPLHGPIWNKNIEFIIDKYDKWSRYEPENRGVLIAYASMYGNTARLAQLTAEILHSKGIDDIEIYDVSKTHFSYIIAKMFEKKNIILASPTYNGNMFPLMHNLIRDMNAVKIQNKSIGLLEGGSWAPMAAKFMRENLEKLKNVSICEEKITIHSSVKTSDENQISAFCDGFIKLING